MTDTFTGPYYRIIPMHLTIMFGAIVMVVLGIAGITSTLPDWWSSFSLGPLQTWRCTCTSTRDDREPGHGDFEEVIAGPGVRDR